MDLSPFVAPALGGVLIGLSASLMLLGSSRIAGISGIVASALTGARPEWWRLSFLAGLVGTGAVLFLVAPQGFDGSLHRSPVALVGAGLLVGFGTRLGSGCTSGHGVCGLSRLSVRSLVAVLTFMAAGIATATLVRVGLGGVL